MKLDESEVIYFFPFLNIGIMFDLFHLSGIFVSFRDLENDSQWN